MLCYGGQKGLCRVEANNICGMPCVGVQPWPTAMLAETVEAASLERRLLTFLVESLKHFVKKEDITLSGKPQSRYFMTVFLLYEKNWNFLFNFSRSVKVFRNKASKSTEINMFNNYGNPIDISMIFLSYQGNVRV